MVVTVDPTIQYSGPVLGDEALGVDVELWSARVGRPVARDRFDVGVGQGMAARLGVVAHAVRRRVRHRQPAHPPLVDVLAALPVVGVRPAHGRDEEVLIESYLKVVRIATAVRIVRADRDIKAQIGAEPFGELGCECRLPRAAVGRQVIQRRGHTFAMHLPRFLIRSDPIGDWRIALGVPLAAACPARRHAVAAKAARRICFRW